MLAFAKVEARIASASPGEPLTGSAMEDQADEGTEGSTPFSDFVGLLEELNEANARVEELEKALQDTKAFAVERTVEIERLQAATDARRRNIWARMSRLMASI